MDEWNPLVKPIPGKMYYTNAEAIEEYMNSLKIEEEQEEYNTVSKPKHYMLFEKEGIEVRDVIEVLVNKFWFSANAPTNKPMMTSDYVQMMQYLMRFMDKNGKEDLEKARWYLDKLIEAY